MNPAFVIGIAGGTGSGKTTVVESICSEVGRDNVTLIQQDHYYKDRSNLPVKERAEINFDHPDAFDNQLLLEHLNLVKYRKSVATPVYDFSRHIRLSEPDIIEPKNVVILEGILIFADPAIRKMLDLRIFVDTDDDIRFIRRLKRDIVERGRSVESVIEQYENTVKPMHLEFVEYSKRYADIILPEGGFNRIGIDVIINNIRETIRSSKY
jgi:uridine kinase